MLKNNPYVSESAQQLGHFGTAESRAIFALAYEQHQRNRIAAITAQSRGIKLPEDLQQLAKEGYEND